MGRNRAGADGVGSIHAVDVHPSRKHLCVVSFLFVWASELGLLVILLCSFLVISLVTCQQLVSISNWLCVMSNDSFRA